VVDRLVAAGHLERTAGPDARSVSIRLTPSGRTQAALLASRREAHMLELLADLSEAERAALRGALERILSRITVDGAAPGHTCRLCDTGACGHPHRCPVTIAAAGRSRR
jgi:rubrerythrin